MLTSPLQVKLEGNLPVSIDDNVLEPHIVKAVIEIKKIITAEKYAEIEAIENNNDDHIACSIAEANLALVYAIPSLNVETQGNGIVRTKGWDHSRSDLLTQDEVAKLQEHYKKVALDLLEPFIPKTDVSNSDADEVRGANYRLAVL